MKMFSIITVNFNNAQGLLKTIKSVQSQIFNDFEYIIIDGGSSDESLNIIEQNKDIIQYYISEKDNGVYHAMNKGLLKATGAYCIFLNSGDCFYNHNVLSIVYQCIMASNKDIYYGNSFKTKPHYRRVIKYHSNLTFYDFYKTEPALHHQATFIKKELFDRFGMYNEKISIIADWEFFFRVIVLNMVETEYIDAIFCEFDGTGASNSLAVGDIERIKANRVKQEILENYFSPMILSDYKVFDDYNSQISIFRKILNKFSYFSLKK